MILCGISASNSSGSPLLPTPSATGSCLAMMMTPIEASMPWTAEVGKKSPRMPVRSRPKSDLEHAGGDRHAQGHLVGLHVAPGSGLENRCRLPKSMDAAEGDDDQAGGRSLDRQLRVAEKRWSETPPMIAVKTPAMAG